VKKRNTVKNQEVFKVERCRACNSKNISTFLQLGPTPAPNGFLDAPQLNMAEKFYPLDVAFCSECGMVQLGHVVDPEVMFKNYVYIPSTSTTMRAHFEGLANDAIKTSDAGKDDLIVDIGSNDGTLLKWFKAKDLNILGVDPAENIVEQANKENVPSICSLFNSNVVEKITKKYGKAKIVTGTNVIAHVHDLQSLFKDVKNLLTDDGVFIGEFPYLVDMLDKVEFDTIYQEHLSYLSVTPMIKLAEKNKMYLFDVKRIPVHGGSIRIFFSKKPRKASANVTKLLKLEKKEEVLNPETYLKFRRRVDRVRHELVQLLWKLKLKNKKVIGYGASAKGNVMLNYCRIGPETLDYIVDSIPYKQGKYTPGTHIPIYPEKKLLEDQPDYVLLLAWNFADEIIKKQEAFRKKGGKFIVSIPRLKVV
jgi:SAM-dependent methyltransferase